MQKSFCGVHVDEEQKYICIHPSCIKEKENTLCCVECFNKHAADRTEFHQKMSYYILLEKAKTNKEAYLKLQESNIDKIQSIFEMFKNQLIQLVEQLRIWQANQLKLLEDSTGAQIKKIQGELKKANSYYKLNKLDNQIFFYFLDYPEQQRLSEESFKNTQRFIGQKMKDYQQLIELLTQKNWNLQSIFQTSPIKYYLPKTTEDIRFETCEEHQEKINQLYINKQIKRSEIGQLSCIKCLFKNRKNEDISSIRNISDLINDEKKKIAKQNAELFSFQNKLTTLVDQRLVLVQKKQKEYYEYFESLKTNILDTENEAIQKLKTTPECDFIFWGIDYNKLFSSITDIYLKFQNEEKSFENYFYPISIALEKQIDLLHQIDQIVLENTNKQLTEQISQMKTHINEYTREISLMQTKNQELTQNISVIQKRNQEQIEQIFQMKTCNNEHTNTIYVMQKRNQELNEQISQMKTCNNEHTKTISVMQKKNQELTEKISVMQKRNQQLTENISEMQKTNQQLTKKISEMQTTNNQRIEKPQMKVTISDVCVEHKRFYATEKQSLQENTNNQYNNQIQQKTIGYIYPHRQIIEKQYQPENKNNQKDCKIQYQNLFRHQ